MWMCTKNAPHEDVPTVAYPQFVCFFSFSARFVSWKSHQDQTWDAPAKWNSTELTTIQKIRVYHWELILTKKNDKCVGVGCLFVQNRTRLASNRYWFSAGTQTVFDSLTQKPQVRGIIHKKPSEHDLLLWNKPLTTALLQMVPFTVIQDVEFSSRGVFVESEGNLWIKLWLPLVTAVSKSCSLADSFWSLFGFELQILQKSKVKGTRETSCFLATNNCWKDQQSYSSWVSKLPILPTWINNQIWQSAHTQNTCKNEHLSLHMSERQKFYRNRWSFYRFRSQNIAFERFIVDDTTYTCMSAFRTTNAGSFNWREQVVGSHKRRWTGPWWVEHLCHCQICVFWLQTERIFSCTGAWKIRQDNMQQRIIIASIDKRGMFAKKENLKCASDEATSLHCFPITLYKWTSIPNLNWDSLIHWSWVVIVSRLALAQDSAGKCNLGVLHEKFMTVGATQRLCLAKADPVHHAPGSH